MLIIEFIGYVCLGAVVGGFVGTVGVGGGALMTPALLFTGMPVHVAIGTDLLYAGITKLSGAIAHLKQRHVATRPLFQLAAGSIPTALLTLMLITYIPVETFGRVIPVLLGIALVATGLVSMALPRPAHAGLKKNKSPIYTVAAGVLLGFLVTITSVGAGAIGAAMLLLLYPGLSGARIVGTDVVHAVPLALIGGLGYAMGGHTDWWILLALLTGSVPAAHYGARLTALIPSQVLRKMIASILLVVGGATAAVTIAG